MMPDFKNDRDEQDPLEVEGLERSAPLPSKNSHALKLNRLPFKPTYKVPEIDHQDFSVSLEDTDLHPSYHVVFLRGAIQREQTAMIQGFFENEIPSDGKTLIFDMKALNSLNTVIWDRIVALHARLKKSGGNVILCGMHGQVEQSFQVLELDKLFVSYSSVADALEVSAKKNHADSLLQGSVPSSFEGDGLAVPVFLSLEDKIRHTIAHNPEQGVRAIARHCIA